MAALGFSLNTLTLFGLVLAIGIVVDDAIVVVENVERDIAAGLIAARSRPSRPWTRSAAPCWRSPWFCARSSSRPPGPPAYRAFYRQFALTIAVSTIISGFGVADLVAGAGRAVAQAAWRGPEAGSFATLSRLFAAFTRFQPGFSGDGRRLCRGCRSSACAQALMLPGYTGLHRPDRWSVRPARRRLHPAARPRLRHRVEHVAAGRNARAHRPRDRAGRRPRCGKRPGVDHAVAFAGFRGATFTNAPNSGVIFVTAQTVRPTGQSRARQRHDPQ